LSVGKLAIAPSLILGVQGHAGVVPPRELLAWSQQFPQALSAHFVGPWCAGETRDAGVAAIPRVDWQSWESELPLLLAPEGVLPRTAAELARLLARPRSQRQPARERGCLGIIATQRTSFEALADALAICGWDAVWWNDPQAGGRNVRQPVAAMVIDADADYQESSPDLRSELLLSLPRIIVQGFAIRQMEATAVEHVRKPYTLAELAAALERAAATNRQEIEAA
jgi:hypothetical protein